MYSPSELLSRLSSVSAPEVIIALVMVLPLVLAKAVRWRVLLMDMGQSISLGSAVVAYAIGMGAGTLTPGQVGDFGKAWYLKARGIALRFGLVSSLLDRLFDLGLLIALMAWVGLVWGTGHTLWPSLSVLALLICASLTLVRGPLHRSVMGVATRTMSRYAWIPGWISLDAKTGQLAVGPEAVARALLLTVLAYAISVARVALLVGSLGESLDLVQTLVVATLASGANLIPVTLAGVGTRDVALLLYLSSLNKSSTVALSLSTLLLLLNLLNLLVGALASVWLPPASGTDQVPSNA
jgi:uncharacterized membrane protein YbhN (UPF0104 family)